MRVRVGGGGVTVALSQLTAVSTERKIKVCTLWWFYSLGRGTRVLALVLNNNVVRGSLLGNSISAFS